MQIVSGSSGSATATFFPNSASPTAAVQQPVPSQAQGNTDTISGTITVGGSSGHKRRGLGYSEEDASGDEFDVVLVSNLARIHSNMLTASRGVDSLKTRTITPMYIH